MKSHFSFLPLSIGLITFPSAIWKMAPASGDGPDTDYFGFPLPWNSRSIAFSLAKEVYVLPFAIDFALYLLVGFFIWRSMSVYVDRLQRSTRLAILSFIWVYGVISSVWIFLSICSESSFNLWYPHKLKILATTVGVGV